MAAHDPYPFIEDPGFPFPGPYALMIPDITKVPPGIPKETQTFQPKEGMHAHQTSPNTVTCFHTSSDR
jgi:hypothetical protein